MMNAADRELQWLNLASGTVYGHCKELREFIMCRETALDGAVSLRF